MGLAAGVNAVGSSPDLMGGFGINGGPGQNLLGDQEAARLAYLQASGESNMTTLGVISGIVVTAKVTRKFPGILGSLGFRRNYSWKGTNYYKGQGNIPAIDHIWLGHGYNV